MVPMEHYAKDFDRWNDEKKRTDANKEYFPLYHEREVHWCRLGVNVGFEQDGTGEGFSRPVLVLKGFSRRVCLVVPLSTSKKRNQYYIPVGDIEGKSAAAIISQIRLVDTRRLDKHIATVPVDVFEDIRKAVKGIL
jgi:mRNA interferase MazF